MSKNLKQIVTLLWLAPVIVGLWLLRAYLRHDGPIPGLPFDSAGLHLVADVLIVGLIALLFLNPRRRPLATREGSVSGPNGYTFSLLLPMALAAIMPAIILYFVFDSLPATVQTFLRSQVVNLSVAALAVVGLVWLIDAARRRDADLPVIRVVISLLAGGLIFFACAFDRTTFHFDLARLHGPAGWIWVAIGGLAASMIGTPAHHKEAMPS